ncbi:MAG: DUF6036 family nucleotidyltransferase [Proteobacteria bacterium]|nr:DUF6036 family nucleotidyltransferase [Pseudomonadota bacterium]
MYPEQVVPQFDAYLAEQGLRYEAVVIGGAALSLLGVVSRTTDDCDVLDPQIPESIREAARAFCLRTLGRLDLLCTKLVALVDRGVDYEDCIALRPTLDELRRAWPFVEQYEGNDESREVYWIPAAKRQMQRLCEELGLDGVF